MIIKMSQDSTIFDKNTEWKKRFPIFLPDACAFSLRDSGIEKESGENEEYAYDDIYSDRF